MQTPSTDWALRARPHKSSFQILLESAGQERAPVGLTTLGTPVLLLLASSAAVYLSYVMLAIATGRHLFGDGSWFLVKMLSENHIAIWNVAGWQDFFVGRFGAVAYQEYPTLLASRLGVRNLYELSIVYGITLFSFKPLSILLCYHFARDKRYVIFPVMTLFAVTMNSEGYLVTETHLMSALFWPALFGILCCKELKRWDLLAMVVISAPLLLCYESMAVYGIVLCGACGYRLVAIDESTWQKWITVAFGLWYALGALFGVMATIYPRDPSQRGAFLQSVLFVFRNDHIGARISCVVMLLCALVLLVPGSYKRTLNVLVGVSVLCSLAIPYYILRHPGRTSLGSHIVARTMNVVVPLGLAVVFLAVCFGFFKLDGGKYRRLFVMAAVLGICQSCWHLIATTQWSQMTVLLRSELRTHTGPVPLEGSLLSQWTVDGYPVRNMHADWPLMSLSIIYADHGRVSTFLLPAIGEFQPFNPFSESTLPDLQKYGIDYRPYLAAMNEQTTSYEPGAWISFNARTNGAGARQIGEWWEPESWGTWTGKDAGLAIHLAKNAESDLILESVAGAFVNEKNPEINVQVRVNDVAVGSWSFHYSEGAQPYQVYTVKLPKEALDKASPDVIWFKVSGARSPSSFGMGGDPRTLGLALVRMRMLPAPR